MNIRDISKPVTARMLNESLAKKFGKRIDIDSFTLEQLQDARNKIRTKLSQVETNESFDAVHTETYQKSKLFLDVLNAAISERKAVSESVLREGAEDQAELVMAAKDMVDRLTSWMEETGEMQTESMLEVADAIRDEFGVEKAQEFSETIKPSLETLYQTMEATRTALIQGVGVLTGENMTPDTMGADDQDLGSTDDADLDSDLGADLDMDLGSEDDFDADLSAAGGDEDAGRERRESIERVSEKKSYSAKQAAAGKDIGKKGKNFSKIAKSAGKQYGSKEAGERVAGAVLKKLRAKESLGESSRRLAVTLSKKK